MNKLALFFLIVFSVQAQAVRYDFFDRVHDVKADNWWPVPAANIKVGVLTHPAARANVIYLHGFADTMDNHGPLLIQLRNSGLNVYAYDYPSHGDSDGVIGLWNLKEVASIISTVMNDKNVKFDQSKPLILVGWSTGATIAVRIAQTWKEKILGHTKLIGMALFAPALPANFCVGDKCIAPEAHSLTRSKDGMRNDPYPPSTVVAGRFAISLVLQSSIAASKISVLPKDIPTLVLVAGDDDSYTTSDNTLKFIERNQRAGAPIIGYQCTNAYHGVEFEPDGIGATSIGLAVKFADAVAGKAGDPVEAARTFGKVDSKICPRVKHGRALL